MSAADPVLTVLLFELVFVVLPELEDELFVELPEDDLEPDPVAELFVVPVPVPVFETVFFTLVVGLPVDVPVIPATAVFPVFVAFPNFCLLFEISLFFPAH